MADTTSVAVEAAPTTPSDDAIKRAAAFTREPFVLAGEDAAAMLAPGSARRRALDAALAELEAGAEVPSVGWRQRWSLLLGLDRLLCQDEPHLSDGTVLSAHQVDALSGTLTALLAESGNGGAPSANGEAAPAPLASVGIPGEEDLEDDDEPEEPQDWEDEAPPEADKGDELADELDDPNAAKRFWFEHATGAGKTVAALGFVEGSRTGGTLILTHRRNLVDQFLGELRDRGYGERISPPLVRGQDRADGPVTVETYQWFVRNAGNVSDAYTIVICDEAHTALGEKTSASIRNWHEPVFIGMTATGALIARHVTDLFPTQTSRFDLAQAARRGVISPLRCVRIPPGPGVRTIAKVPLRRGEVDTEFDQEMLAELLDQLPFNLAVADLYKTRFNGVPGVVYAAGVRHAYNVAEAFRDVGLKAQAVSGETPKRQLAEILARYERGAIDVLVNAQLLAEGWNSPRATVCMHLAPTASKRIYQQRVGRVTRRHQGKEAGIVVDFVHPATKHDDPVVTLHSLLDREVYRGGAIVVGPVRRGRGRRLRVERRVLPVTADENRRIEVFERELWRIAVEHLDYGEQVQWAALAGARVTPAGWRRARAMLHFDQGGELKRTFLITAVDRNKNAQLRLRALQEIAASRDAEAFDRALDFVESWPRDDKREGVKVVLQALAERSIGRRDQATAWLWRLAEYTREVHEEYAVQRWPETKRLLGLLVNSSGGAHARNARRLVHAARQQDRRLSAALLAAAIPHTAEAGEVVNGARTRMSRKPAALARELLRNFPKGKGRRGTRRRRKKGAAEGVAPEAAVLEATRVALEEGAVEEPVETGGAVEEPVETGGAVDETQPAPRRSRRKTAEPVPESPLLAAAAAVEAAARGAEEPAPASRRRRAAAKPADEAQEEPAARRGRAAKPDDVTEPAARRGRAAKPDDVTEPAARRGRAAKPDDVVDAAVEPAPRRRRVAKSDDVVDAAVEPAPRRRRAATPDDVVDAAVEPAPRRRRAAKSDDVVDAAVEPARAAKPDDVTEPAPRRRRAATPDDVVDAAVEPAPRRRRAAKSDDVVDAAVEPAPRRRRAAKPDDASDAADEPARRRGAAKADDVIEAAAEPASRRRRAAKPDVVTDAVVPEAAEPASRRRRAGKPDDVIDAAAAPASRRRRAAKPDVVTDAVVSEAAEPASRRRRGAQADEVIDAAAEPAPRRRRAAKVDGATGSAAQDGAESAPRRRRAAKRDDATDAAAQDGTAPPRRGRAAAETPEMPATRRRRATAEPAEAPVDRPPRRRAASRNAVDAAVEGVVEAVSEDAAKPVARQRAIATAAEDAAQKPAGGRRARKAVDAAIEGVVGTAVDDAAKPAPSRRRAGARTVEDATEAAAGAGTMQDAAGAAAGAGTVEDAAAGAAGDGIVQDAAGAAAAAGTVEDAPAGVGGDGTVQDAVGAAAGAGTMEDAAGGAPGARADKDAAKGAKPASRRRAATKAAESSEGAAKPSARRRASARKAAEPPVDEPEPAAPVASDEAA